MPTMELTEKEARAVERMRMSPDARHIATLTGIEQSRQARFAAMTPEKREAAEKALADRQTELARVAALTPEARKAEMLTAQKERLTAELVKVDTELADPAIAEIAQGLVDGKASPAEELGG